MPGESKNRIREIEKRLCEIEKQLCEIEKRLCEKENEITTFKRATGLIEIKWSVRQNMWKCATGIFETVQTTNVLICSGYHSKESCPDNLDGPLILNLDNKSGNKYMDIDVGDYAIIFASGEKSVLCVKITSPPYRKEIPEITIYKKKGHKNEYGSEEVEVCLQGQNTRPHTHTETMVAYVRDIEIIKELTYEEYPEIINKYKTLQTSIAQNRSDSRFIRL